MTHYTESHVFPSFNDHATPLNLTIKANGGSVNLEVQVSDDVWVQPASLELPDTTDVSTVIDVAGCTIRITPTGGAEYNFGGGV